MENELTQLLKESELRRRMEGSFDQLIQDLTKELYVLRMASGDTRAGADFRAKKATEAIQGHIRRWVELNPECICWDGNPENYEGPQRDCPIHGEKSDG